MYLDFLYFQIKDCFVLNDKMDLKLSSLKHFLKKNRDKRILIFGFYSHYLEIFHSKIQYEKKQIDLSNAILIHGGGWKKMVDEQVDNVKFKKILKTKFKIKKVYNYYGMVEQTGSIYLECEEGLCHTNSFNDIIIRDQ